jgi:hypothetical protein
MTPRLRSGQAHRRLCGVSLLLALAAAPAIPDIKVTPVVASGNVLATFVAADAFGDESRELVRNGVPLTLTYLVEVRRPSTVWLDRTVGSTTVAAKVKFDSLTSMFLVTKEQDARVTSSKSTAKEDEMRRWATEFDAVPVAAQEPLEPNADYYVRVSLDAHPNLKFSLWPFSRAHATGRADFTFIR